MSLYLRTSQLTRLAGQATKVRTETETVGLGAADGAKRWDVTSKCSQTIHYSWLESRLELSWELFLLLLLGVCYCLNPLGTVTPIHVPRGIYTSSVQCLAPGKLGYRLPCRRLALTQVQVCTFLDQFTPFVLISLDSHSSEYIGADTILIHPARIK